MRNAFKGMIAAVIILLLYSFIKLQFYYGNGSRPILHLPSLLWSTPVPQLPSSTLSPTLLSPTLLSPTLLSPTLLSPTLLSPLTMPPSPMLDHEHESRCKGLTKWVVITTDSRIMTPAVATLLNSTIDWCLLVLGLEGSYSTADLSTSNMIYLPRKELVLLPYKLVSITAVSTFNRRNIGYLYAINRGAKVILDMNENRVPHTIYQAQLYENKQQLYKIPSFVKDDATGKVMC